MWLEAQQVVAEPFSELTGREPTLSPPAQAGEKRTTDMAKLTFKSLADAVKACGGEDNAINIIARYVEHKQRQKSDRQLVKWAKEQQAKGRLTGPTA